ncbi:MAG: DUF1566 domain-containing protein [Bacteroidaceae bacterium]|nr:DUF1566 domain-containing protein [Bacteroidaceae bacterium]
MDLGLPSGIKWATCNIGASSPSDYGDYFAWRETEPNSYTVVTHKTWETEFGDISGNSQHDAARANWGGSWRLPSLAECQELRDECSWTWTSQEGHNGCKVIGPNGNSIFLPAAGGGFVVTDGVGVSGRYWSSTPPYESNPQNAYGFGFIYGNPYVGYDFRHRGRPIRPVSE